MKTGVRRARPVVDPDVALYDIKGNCKRRLCLHAAVQHNVYCLGFFTLKLKSPTQREILRCESILLHIYA